MVIRIFNLELLIALGGEGCRMLAATLRDAERRLGRVPPSWRWIALDSDPRSAALLPFTNGQFLLLRSIDGPAILGQISKGDLNHCLATVGDPSMLKETRPGCQGQKMPRIGYLHGIFNAATWESLLTETLQQFLPVDAPQLLSETAGSDLHFDTSKVHVKVFAGIGGGQGGALHRQVAIALRDFAQREGFSSRTFFTLVAALTNYSTDKAERSRELANEGARLAELDLYQSSADFGHALTFPNGAEARWAGRLYDMVKLVEPHASGKTAGTEMADRVGSFVSASMCVPEIGEHLHSYVIANELVSTAPADEGETGWITTGGYSEILLPPRLGEVLAEHALSRIFSRHLAPADGRRVRERVERFMRSALAGDARELFARISQVYEGGDISQAIEREMRRRLPTLGVSDEALARVGAIAEERISDWKFYGGASEDGLAKIRDAFGASLDALVSGMRSGVTRQDVETIRGIIDAVDRRIQALADISGEAVMAEEEARVAYADAEADYQGGGGSGSFLAAAEAAARQAAASARLEASQMAQALLEEGRQALSERLPDCERLLDEYAARRDRADRRSADLTSELLAQTSRAAFPLASGDLLERLAAELLDGPAAQNIEQQVAESLGLSSPVEFALHGLGDGAESEVRQRARALIEERLETATAAELFILSAPNEGAAMREVRRLMARAEGGLKVSDDYGRGARRYGLITVDRSLASAPFRRLLGEVKKEFRHWQIVESDERRAVQFYYLQIGVAPSLVPTCQKAFEAMRAVPEGDRLNKLFEPGLSAAAVMRGFGRARETDLRADEAFLLGGALGLIQSNGGGFTFKHSNGVARLGGNPRSAIGYLARAREILASLNRATRERADSIGEGEKRRRVRDFRAHLKQYYEVGPRDLPEDAGEAIHRRNGHKAADTAEPFIAKGGRNGSTILPVQ